MRNANLYNSLVPLLLFFGGAVTSTAQDRVTTGKLTSLNAITWTGSRWCAVGDSGRVSLSDDGVVWNDQASGTNATLFSLAASKSHLVAVGKLWRPVGARHAQSLGPSLSLGTFVPARLHSTDGTSWDSLPFFSSTTPLPRSVSWSGNRFRIFQQTTQQCSGPETLQVCTATAPDILLSPDGIHWSYATFPDSGSQISAMAASGSKWLALSDLPNGQILVSNDDSTWRPIGPPPVAGLVALVGNIGSSWIAAGKNGWIGSSNDGIVWKRVGASLGNSSIEGLAQSASWTVAVGSNGFAAASPDGTSWFRVPTGTSANLHAVAAHDSVFVAVGDSGNAIRITVESLLAVAASVRRRVSSQFGGHIDWIVLPNSSRQWIIRIMDIGGRIGWSGVAAPASQLRWDSLQLHAGIWRVELRDGERLISGTVLIP